MSHQIPENEWRNLKRLDMIEKKTHEDTPLLVNIKGKQNGGSNSTNKWYSK